MGKNRYEKTRGRVDGDSATQLKNAIGLKVEGKKLSFIKFRDKAVDLAEARIGKANKQYEFDHFKIGKFQKTST